LNAGDTNAITPQRLEEEEMTRLLATCRFILVVGGRLVSIVHNRSAGKLGMNKAFSPREPFNDVPWRVTGSVLTYSHAIFQESVRDVQC